MAAEKNRGVEIFPPIEPLKFPLIPIQICRILGLSKSTLLRWERDGLIPPIQHFDTDLLYGRGYFADDLTRLLLAMKAMTFSPSRGRTEVKLRFPWLANFDPAIPCELITPSRFHIKFESRE